MSEIRWAIVGSRNFPDRQLVIRSMRVRLLNMSESGDTLTIVSGHAEGPDQWAEEFARANGLGRIILPPRYDAFPPQDRWAAPLWRNRDIVAVCTDLTAFWHGRSTGTADTIVEAHKAGKLRHVNSDLMPTETVYDGGKAYAVGVAIHIQSRQRVKHPLPPRPEDAIDPRVAEYLKPQESPR